MPVPNVEQLSKLNAARAKHERIADYLVDRAIAGMPEPRKVDPARVERVREAMRRALTSPLFETRVSHVKQLGGEGELGLKALAKLLGTAPSHSAFRFLMEDTRHRGEGTPKNIYPEVYQALVGGMSDEIDRLNKAGKFREREPFYWQLHEEIRHSQVISEGNRRSLGYAIERLKQLNLEGKPDSALEHELIDEHAALNAFDDLFEKREELLNVESAGGDAEDAKLAEIVENAKRILRAAPVNPGLSAEVFEQLRARFDKSGRQFPFADLEDGELKELYRKLERAQHGQRNLFGLE